ncbi:hypothetical protein CIPAW_04G156200 [Carya illinoinensis]|uniref:Uncharacterized protein n=1 Tax=Carya illinoinensis TaxID=32201 RepID=A0A8T1QTN4_CARIL|nr:hypothetical protein CIPAW_04G156200 [Carya illinoinensis]KAG6658370.1 hypothetical protein CIPAW_04G156200 [Carya illinoinensis]KAG6658371.1 hypothetical protein CIPAW_04G156200 [Carya illinoinensis]
MTVHSIIVFSLPEQNPPQRLNNHKFKRNSHPFAPSFSTFYHSQKRGYYGDKETKSMSGDMHKDKYRNMDVVTSSYFSTMGQITTVGQRQFWDCVKVLVSA